MSYLLTYSYSNNAYTVTGYEGTPIDVVIPSTYNDGTNGEHPVTAIGNNAFADSGLKSITIPDTVTSIGYYTFGSSPDFETMFLFPTTPPVIASDNLYSSVQRIYCFSKALDAYKSATGWNIDASKIIADDARIYFTANANSTKKYIDSAAAIKVDKVSIPDKIYGTDANGNQTTYDKDSLGGGQVDDVQINGTSIVTNKIANITIDSALNASSDNAVKNSVVTEGLAGKQDSVPTITLTQSMITGYGGWDYPGTTASNDWIRFNVESNNQYLISDNYDTIKLDVRQIKTLLNLPTDYVWIKRNATNSQDYNGTTITLYQFFVAYDGFEYEGLLDPTNPYVAILQNGSAGFIYSSDYGLAWLTFRNFNITDIYSRISVLETGKQDKLTFDNTPTAGSLNPVTSEGIKTAINNAQPVIEDYVS